MTFFKRVVIATAVIVVVTAGCATQNGLRQQVNSASAVAHDYEIQAAHEKADNAYRQMVNLQIQAMNAQIADLKDTIARFESDKAVANHVAAGPISAAPTDKVIQIKAMRYAPGFPVGRATRKAPVSAQISSDSQGAVEIHDNSVVFTVRHEFAKTMFNPSDTMKAEILDAATKARIVDVRGRTDSFYVNPGNRKIALARANSAREFLMHHGVAVNKIKLSFMSANGFVADNATSHGRALNRRVELEMKGINTASIDDSGGVKFVAGGLPSHL